MIDKNKIFLPFLVVIYSTSINADFKLQLLHTNDMHSRFEEVDLYTGTCTSETESCFGGFARLKHAVDDAKKGAKERGIPSIFLNAGDTFQGTAHYTIFKWRIVAAFIDNLGIDVMCLGNHEFDDGIDDLVSYMNTIKTPLVACNLNLTSEPRLKVPNLTPSYVLTVNNTKIGVIGYLTPEATELSKTENLEIFDEIPYLRAEAQSLKKKGVKIIIALGHSGFYRDVEIAAAVPEISVIVGAHSHSLLYTPQDKPPSIETALTSYPHFVTHKWKRIPVVQSYCNTKYLGKMILTFDDNGDVTMAEGNSILLNSTFQKDAELQSRISKWSNEIDGKLSEAKGRTRVFLAKQDLPNGPLESNLANLITDAFLDYGVQYALENNSSQWTEASIAFIQDGGIRMQIDHKKNNGLITVGDILTLLPFQDPLYMAKYNGSTIKAALEHSVSEPALDRGFHFFLFASGLKIKYDFSKPPGSRVESITVLCKMCSIPHYVPLKMDQSYNVIISHFIAEGGDTFKMFKRERLNLTKLGITDTDAFAAYVQKNKIVYPAQDGRISSASSSVISFCVLLMVPTGFGFTNNCLG